MVMSIGFKIFRDLFLFATLVDVRTSAAVLTETPEALRFTFNDDNCDLETFYGQWTDSSSNDSNQTDIRLRRNLLSTFCDPSQLGFSAAQNTPSAKTSILWSEATLSDLLQHVRDRQAGISFELWIKPANNSDLVHPILTLGERPSVSNHTYPGVLGDIDNLSSCDVGRFDFLLAQRGSELEMYFATDDSVFSECQRYRSPALSLTNDRLAHVVVSLYKDKQLILVNGVIVARLNRPFSNTSSHWHADYGLSLFSHSKMADVWPVWKGTIYQLTIHADFLTDYKTKQLLRKGLPETRPYSMEYALQINEDAETTAGSHKTSWYLQQQPVSTAQRLELRIGWLDQEVLKIQQESNTTDIHFLRPTYVYIAGLPNEGCLYQTDGSKIGCEMVSPGDGGLLSNLAPISSSPPEVVYLPPLNRHSSLEIVGGESVFGSLQYCVSDSVVITAEHCRLASVHINIRPVNDPPVAVPPEQPITIQEGIESRDSPSIWLSGTDVDEDDEVKLVQIIDPPRNGYLLLNVRKFRKDGLLDGTKLSDLNFTVSSSGTDPTFVKYIWNPDGSSPIIVQGKSATDSFTFRVADRHGAWSAKKRVQIEIVSGLVIQAKEQVNVKEDSRLEEGFKWRGNDVSGYQRLIGIYVEYVSSGGKGVFFDVQRKVAIESGDLLDYAEAFPYERGFDVTFIPSPDFCSHPSISDSKPWVQFRIVAFDRNKEIRSISDSWIQSVNVECVIDRVTVDIPTNQARSTAMSLDSAFEPLCFSSPFNTTTKTLDSCNTILTVRGLHFDSRDNNTNTVLVSVFAGDGYLTFNEEFWNRARPISGRRDFASGKVSFYAYPNDLESIFDGLLFQTFHGGSDNIDIVIEYRDCKAFDLLADSDDKKERNCTFDWYSIDVMVDGWPDQVVPQLVSGFPWQIIICILGYPALYYSIVRSLYTRKRQTDERDDETVDEVPLWIQHLSSTGEFYYENTETGEVTWLAPVGEDFSPWTELEDA